MERAGAAEVSVLAVEQLLRRSVAWWGTPGRRVSRGPPLNLPPRGLLVRSECPQFGWFLVLGGVQAWISWLLLCLVVG